MKKTPRISIVIPTYNRASDLERALKSLKAQTFINWEVLIIDNESVDNTDEVVSGFSDPRMKLFKIDNDGVIAASRNLGIREASGEYIAFLDSDDWWKPKKLEESVKCLETGADIVYHDLFLVTQSNQRFFWRRARSRDLRSPVFNDLIENGNTLLNSSVVVKRSILNEINGFSESRELIAIEDYDGWLRAAKITEKFKKIHKPLGYYWLGGGNTSSPERTLRTILALEARYPNIALSSGQGSNNYLHSYIKGRAEYKLKSYNKAKKHFELICWNRTPFLIYVKTLWMLFLINVSS
jgi:glycosyltransferase involved in cell wall biosynthesis